MIELMTMIGVCFGLPTALALLFSGRWRQVSSLGWSLAAIAAVLVNIIVVGLAPAALPQIAMVQGLQWNWIGKVATIIATLAIFFCLPKKLQKEAGLLTLPRLNNWKPLLAGSALLLAFFWGAAYVLRDGTAASAEYYAFQALMPSLDEEFAYRGTILALLVAALGKPYSFAGIKIGWGALPIIAVFGLVHGYSQLAGGTTAEPISVATTVMVTGLAGAGLLWIKEMTGSIWLCVFMHSLMNLGSGFFNGFPG